MTTTTSLTVKLYKCPHCFLVKVLEQWRRFYYSQERAQPKVIDAATGIAIALADLITKVPDQARQEEILDHVVNNLPRYVEEIRKGEDPAEGRLHHER